ncbi:MAG: sigma-70 family RNA polymerase sigma factor [Agriterribacter sp.]
MTTQSIENTLEGYFTNIFKRHEYKLYTLVLSLTKSDEYAKDVVQDVFMKLWLQRTGIYSIENIEIWLYRLTESRILDFLQKTSSEKKLRDTLWINMRNSFAEPVEEKISEKAYTSIIDKAINQLPPQRKRIYRLSKEDGFNYRELIDYLKKSRNTVKNQFSHVVYTVKNLFK